MNQINFNSFIAKFIAVILLLLTTADIIFSIYLKVTNQANNKYLLLLIGDAGLLLIANMFFSLGIYLYARAFHRNMFCLRY